MENFAFHPTEIHGLQVIQPQAAPDARGVLLKTFASGLFQRHGISLIPSEALCSRSGRGVVRGLHFQRRHSQDKLVQVLHGAVFDVAVDLRLRSPTFGRWKGVVLSGENRTMLYIPKGFAHGFLALEEDSCVSYLCGAPYFPEYDGGILWNDPEVGVAWPTEGMEEIILSGKDRNLPTLAAFQATWGGLPYGGMG